MTALLHALYTPEQFVQKMREAINSDVELTHLMMDDIMCELLISLGYQEGVAIFDAEEK